MKKQNNSSFTILTLLFLFSVALASPPSSWPYFHPNSGFTSIIIPDGLDTIWHDEFGLSISPTTSPVMGWINDTTEAVFVATSYGMLAINAVTGDLIWDYPTSESLKYAPIYLDSAHLCVSMGDSLICLDPQTGAKTWSYPLGGQGFHVVGLYNRFGVVTDNGKLFVFDHIPPRDSSWQVGPLPGGGCDNIAPICDNQGYVYVVTLGTIPYTDFNLCKIGPNGDIVYSPDYFFAEPGGVRMTPGLKHDSILIFGTDTLFGWTSSIYNYRISDHRQALRRTFIYSDGPVMASPAIDTNGYTYFSTANFLLALDDANNQRWQSNFSFDASSPAIDGNHKIVFGTADGHLVVLNQGGVAMYDFFCGGDLCSPAIGSDGSVYIAGGNQVYKFGAALVGQKESSHSSLPKIEVSPNPCSSYLTIQTTTTIEIYDLSGRRIFHVSHGPVVWRPSNLPSGVYLVKIDRQIFKVVKN